MEQTNTTFISSRLRPTVRPHSSVRVQILRYRPYYARSIVSIMPGRTWRDNGHKALCPLSLLSLLLALCSRAYSAYRATWLPATARVGDRYHSTLASCGCCGPCLHEAHEGTHHELDPFLTCSRGASILKWVRLEFRLIMHEMNRVTDSE